MSVWAALRHRRNEDGYVQLVRWLAKSVTEKNNRRVVEGKGKKDHRSPDSIAFACAKGMRKGGAFLPCG